MNNLYLLQSAFDYREFKPALFSYATAFAVTMICIPVVIYLVRYYNLMDYPGARKVHRRPMPSMGGLAIFAGLMVSMLIWVNFGQYDSLVSFLLSLILILCIGFMDDLKDLPARYKIIIEAVLAFMIALSGTRIVSFNGLFGLYELPLTFQYTITIIAITGIINAFNLIDGIDGLAGGLAFMSLVTLGLFLTLSHDSNYALIAFSLAGALLAFLYYNLNPARIFMGDTGSLIVGFVISLLCIRFIKINAISAVPVVPNTGLFTLGIVLIPVFDAVRVFSIRLWNGRSPFSPDKNHIHHLITQYGFSHGFAARLISLIQAVLLLGLYKFRQLPPEIYLGLMVAFMFGVIFFLRHSYVLKRIFKPTGMPGYKMGKPST